MRAAWYEKRGAAADVIQVGNTTDPEAGPDEVRVKLFASGVNPSDVGRRGGEGQPMEFPRVIANSDGAGIVDQVGKSVTGFEEGDRVWLYNGQRGGRAFGTAAEYIALDASLVSRLPDNTDFDAGACLGIPCMTAHRCLFADGPVTGKTVLVTGGAGAVGHYAVQLAKWRGAHVITTTSSEHKANHAKEGGADESINYRTEDTAVRIMALTEGEGVDRIVDVDFGGNLEVSLKVLKNNSELIGYASGGAAAPALPFHQLMGRNIAVRGMILNSCPPEARRLAQAEITEWLEEGIAVHSISARFPLADTAKAHEHVESGTKLGTAVVEPA